MPDYRITITYEHGFHNSRATISYDETLTSPEVYLNRMLAGNSVTAATPGKVVGILTSRIYDVTVELIRKAVTDA
jgi:hypothetical protein